MKQTNYYLFDFLDFNTQLDGNEILWKALKSKDIEIVDNDIIVTIPFQKQKVSNDISPDLNVYPANHKLRIRAYGDKIVRLSIGFDTPIMDESPILEIDKKLKSSPLFFERKEEKWIIKDRSGNHKAIINLAEPVIDHWSDLLPKPEETLDITFFPDCEKEIRISAYDQFFPARHDAMALAYVENKGKKDRATISFHANPDKVFVGTGERFTKMDLTGKTFQLENQDGQGVNNRRTYKNIPFFISSRMYGVFLHTPAATKFSMADHSTRSVQLLAEY